MSLWELYFTSRGQCCTFINSLCILAPSAGTIAQYLSQTCHRRLVCISKLNGKDFLSLAGSSQGIIWAQTPRRDTLRSKSLAVCCDYLTRLLLLISRKRKSSDCTFSVSARTTNKLHLALLIDCFLYRSLCFLLSLDPLPGNIHL